MTSLAAFAVVVALGSPFVGADLVGVVREESTGEPVAGAVVSLDDLGRAAVTDAEGAYRLSGVPAGPQHLSVGLLGFQSRSLHVRVPARGVLRVDILLRTDPIEVEAVVVRNRIPLPGVDEHGESLDPARRVGGAAIRNDPFSAEPDVLAALVGGSVAETPESGGGLHVRGGDSDEIGYLLDGVPVFSPYHSGVRSGAWSPDAVAHVELRVDPTLPVDGLSGAVLVTTVEPGERLRSRGGASTSQIGGTLHGPLVGGSGFLLSGRAGFPGLVNPPDEPSYLGGGDHDLLAKLVVPLRAGAIRLLGFDNRNVVEASNRSSEIDDVPSDPGERNRYAWHGRSFGAHWEGGRWGGARPSVRAWRARLDTSFDWNGESVGPARVDGDRTQLGAVAALSWSGAGDSVELGIRMTRDEVSYSVATGEAAPTGLRGSASDAAVFARAARPIGTRFALDTDIAALWGSAGVRFLPRIRAQARVASSTSVHVEYARSEQTIQSLRNAESVVGRIFPAELFAGGESTGIPVARSDQVTAGIVAVPWPGARLDVEGYARALDDLAMLDPQDGKPFSSGGVARGSGSAAGVAAGLAVSAARYAATVSFALERVSVRIGDLEWTPAYSTGRTLRVGAIAYPTTTLSIRSGWIGQFGRRGSDVVGLLEWESCNLLDRGCEFAGSPEELGSLGGRDLPAYHRLDVSIRKHWHFLLGGREASVEAFASASNLLGRSNVLVFAVDPSSGTVAPIEMRPRAPLTLGLGWRF